jgi:hypothetical protein
LKLEINLPLLFIDRNRKERGTRTNPSIFYVS